MRRLRTPVRLWLSVMVAAVVSALALGACTSGSSPQPRPSASSTGPSDGRPNIVFVLTDDLSSDLVQYMPHVVGLERQGTSFSNYFVVDSLCCPSRSAIFTGQYPHNDGVFTNQGSDGGYGGFNRHGDADKTFAVALHQAGYRTGFMGKYLNGYEPKNKRGAGWDDWVAAGNGYPEFDYQLNQNGKLHSYGHDPDDYLTDVLSSQARKFIDTSSKQGKAFALEVATFAPHHPWVPAPRDRNTFPTITAPRGPTYDRTPTKAPHWLAAYPPLSAKDRYQINVGYRKRVESVQAVDRMVGALEQQLRRSGQLRNTYFVFSSDNGFHMGQYRMLPGKQTAFDTDIRVPLVVTGPGVPAGGTVSAMTSSIDLAPTFTQLGDATPADEPDGTSLLSLLHGHPPPANWQQSILVEHHGPDVTPSDPDRQPVRSGDPPSYEAIRTPSAVYVEYATGEREYYDIRRDPNELHNIASTVPVRRITALHRALRKLSTCRGIAACQSAARVG